MTHINNNIIVKKETIDRRRKENSIMETELWMQAIGTLLSSF